jgi:hypothetical protein
LPRKTNGQNKNTEILVGIRIEASRKENYGMTQITGRQQEGMNELARNRKGMTGRKE